MWLNPLAFIGKSCWLLLAIAFLHACTVQEDSKPIDFNQTIPDTPSAAHSSDDAPLRFAIGAMVSPKATFAHYRELLDYVGAKLGRPVQLVQRKTYKEINEMLGQGDIDLAFICSGPYILGKEKQAFEAVATPQIRGSHFYQSYLIVNADSDFKELQDLRGRLFAFTDPDSLTGKLVPTYWLAEMGERPESFFSQVIFTYSHDNSILAVAKGLVDGASVDGLVWDYFQQTDPTWSSKTQVIKKSDLFGIPPLVVSKALSGDIRERLRQVLFTMHTDPEGRKILAGLMIDRFELPNDSWYGSIREIESTIIPPER
jgi:phosphonate transport system substrate-binding protein